jgi:WD40 repeat protein
MQTLTIKKKKRIYAIAFSPSGEELAAVCGDGFLRIWELASGTVRRAASIEETSSGYDLVYLSDSRIVYGGTSLQVWDPVADVWQMIASGSPWGRRLKVAPCGNYLVQVDQSRSTEWTAGAGVLVRSTSNWQLLSAMPEAIHTTGGMAFSRDNRFLATGHMAAVGFGINVIGSFGSRIEYTTNEYDYLVRVRDWPSGTVQRTIGGWQQAVTHLAFTPDGRFLAGTAGPRLRVWDLDTDREVVVHKRGTKHFQGLSFTVDGRYLATVSNDETVRVWDTRTWSEHTTFTWEIGRLLNISFAPDGLRVAAGSDKGQIVIWDVE